MNSVKLNLSPLRTLRRQVSELGKLKVQVGLFQANAGRSSGPGKISDNPSLGAIHEFGSSYSVLSNRATISIPERSWLRMPLMTQLGPQMLAKAASWLYILRTQGAKRTVAVLGALAVDLIAEAFATGGFGSWAPLARETIRRKHSSRILIESSQMRKAVTYRII